MKKILLTTAMFTVLIFEACKKEQTPVATNPASSSTTNVANTFTNPFEELGKLHNEAMDYATQYPGFPRLSDVEAYESVYPFIQSHFQATRINSEELKSFRKRVNQLADGNAPEILFQEGRIDSTSRNLLSELFGIFSKSRGTIVSGYEMSEKIKALESKIMKQSGVPSPNLKKNTNIAYVLASCAVARYSYEYWSKASQDSKSPWYPLLEEQNKKIDWHRVWCIVKADVIGFVVGGFHLSNGVLLINIEDGISGAIVASSGV